MIALDKTLVDNLIIFDLKLGTLNMENLRKCQIWILIVVNKVLIISHYFHNKVWQMKDKYNYYKKIWYFFLLYSFKIDE